MAAARALADLVAAIDNAMVVVTAAADGEQDGCLVGFHCQSSIEPPAYAVWLSKANRTRRLAERATHLAVHLLREDQHDLARLFGGETGDEVDKLAQVTWTPGGGGAPLLADCPDRLEGRIAHVLDVGGDHICVVLDPVSASATGSGPPLRLGAATDIDPGHPA